MRSLLPQAVQGFRLALHEWRWPAVPGRAMQAVQRHEQRVVIQPVCLLDTKFLHLLTLLWRGYV